MLAQKAAMRDKTLQTIKQVLSPLLFSTSLSTISALGAGNRACWTCHCDLLSAMIISGETARRKCWLQFYFTNPKTAEIIYFCCKTTTHTHSSPATNFGCHRNPASPSALKLNSGTQRLLFITSRHLQYTRETVKHLKTFFFLFKYMYKLFSLKKGPAISAPFD